MLDIIEKGTTFELSVKSKQDNGGTYYFGAGWDNPNGPVDLDIVCAVLHDGKITGNDDLVYFGNKTAPGVTLSEDNTTGEGAYSGADLHGAPNAHFRVCDGDQESSEQIGDVVMGDATAGDTVLVAFALNRTDAGWTLENKSELHQKGQGSGAIQGFGSLYQ
jgi:stress response protein SCP2